MGYIKCKLYSRVSNKDGVTKYVRIGRLESDMADANMYELPILMHALSIKGKVELTSVFSLDKSYLDNDLYILG